MEPDMAVSLIAKNKLLEKLSTRITVLIADDDSATISNVRKNVSWPVDKWSDINHVKKNMTTQLYALKLPRPMIKYFARRLTMILQSNKNDPEAIRELLLCAVDHAYGLHEKCGLWCGYVQDPAHYVYRNLPGKKPFKNNAQKENIKAIFKKLSDDVEKIAPCGSTQRNESFNHTVAVSHPKPLFFASTQSFPSRVNVAALKTNEHSSYVIKINEKAGYSPGKWTEQYRSAKDEISKRRAQQLRDPESRRKRNQRKEQRLRQEYVRENQEGISYEPGCSQFNFQQILDNVQDNEGNYFWIGPKFCRHFLIVFKFFTVTQQTGEEILIYFDLETTSLSVNRTEICQLAAAADNNNVFNRYILPSFGINKCASLVTGLTTHDGRLYHEDEILETVSIQVALADFLNFLDDIRGSQKITLVAHNNFE